MKRKILPHLIMAMMIIAAVLSAESQMLKIFADDSVATGQSSHLYQKTISVTIEVPYLLYLPADYDPEKKWPLIMFLHGIGQSGDKPERVADTGLPQMLKNDKNFPFIVLSPQCPRGQWWDNKTLITLLDDILGQYSIDKERIYLTGLSMGGFGTWSLACAYPERFAAIAPICGGGEPIFARQLKDMPIWAFHGAKDQAVPVERSRQMVDAVNRSGGNAKLTIYPEANHDSWTQTYKNQELYDWFLSHRKTK